MIVFSKLETSQIVPMKDKTIIYSINTDIFTATRLSKNAFVRLKVFLA